MAEIVQYRKEPLTSLERVALALQYRQPDRVPVAPLVCGASHRVLGISYARWSQDAKLATQSLLDAQELIGFDSWLTLVDLSVEAANFGQEVIFPNASTAYPNTDNPRIKTVQDYYTLEKVDPLQSKRMRHVIDVVGAFRRRGEKKSPSWDDHLPESLPHPAWPVATCKFTPK